MVLRRDQRELETELLRSGLPTRYAGYRLCTYTSAQLRDVLALFDVSGGTRRLKIDLCRRLLRRKPTLNGRERRAARMIAEYRTLAQAARFLRRRTPIPAPIPPRPSTAAVQNPLPAIAPIIHPAQL